MMDYQTTDQGADEDDVDGPEPDPGLDSVHDQQQSNDQDPPQAGINDILRPMPLAQEQRDRDARASEDRFFFSF